MENFSFTLLGNSFITNLVIEIHKLSLLSYNSNNTFSFSQTGKREKIIKTNPI